jgi:hypothetical protein
MTSLNIWSRARGIGLLVIPLLTLLLVLAATTSAYAQAEESKQVVYRVSSHIYELFVTLGAAGNTPT